MTGPILSSGDIDVLRADEESMMQDTALCRRPTGRDDQDNDTWLEEPTFEDRFVTPCMVAGGSRQGEVTVRTVTVGGVDLPVLEGGLRMPIPEDEFSPAVDVRQGDQFVITAIGPRTDPGVLRNVYEVVEYGGKSYSTARRLDVVLVGIEEA